MVFWLAAEKEMKGIRHSKQITIVWCQVHVVVLHVQACSIRDEELGAVDVRRAGRVKYRRLVVAVDLVRISTGFQQLEQDDRLSADRTLILAANVDGRAPLAIRWCPDRIVEPDDRVVADQEQLADRWNHFLVAPRRRSRLAHLVQEILTVFHLVGRLQAHRTTNCIDQPPSWRVVQQLEIKRTKGSRVGRLACRRIHGSSKQSIQLANLFLVMVLQHAQIILSQVLCLLYLC